MDIDNCSTAIVYHGRTAYFLEPIQTPVRLYGYSYFGGPLEGPYGRKPEGKFPKRFPLHRLLTIDTDILPGLEKSTGGSYWGFPVLYGLQYSGCMLEYKFSNPVRNVQVTGFSGETSDKDWPYANYPAILPFSPLRVAKQCNYEPDEFFNTFTWQGLSGGSFDLVIVLPNNAIPGVSLWGPENSEVLVICEADLQKGIARVTNQTD